MKNLVMVLWMILGLSLGASAEGTRGGGKGVVCRDKNGKVKSVELLDLWEAKMLYKRKIKTSNASTQTQVAQALTGVGPALNPFGDERNPGPYGSFGEVAQKNLQQTAQLFFKNSEQLRWLEGVSLSLTDDSYEIAKPADCEIEQIADFKDLPGVLYINADLYRKMNATNQAALIVHEAIYYQIRSMTREDNSLRVRRAVGYIFSGNKLPGSTVPGTYMRCSGGEVNSQIDVAIYQNKDQKTFSSVTRWDEGMQVLGFFPIMVTASGSSMPESTTENILQFLSPGVCQQLGSHNMLRLWIGSKSPITYDRSAALFVSCFDGQIDIRYSSGKSGGMGDISKEPKVNCRMVTE